MTTDNSRADALIEAAKACDDMADANERLGPAAGRGSYVQKIGTDSMRRCAKAIRSILAASPVEQPAAAPIDWCDTMERPKSQCGCPDCGSSLIDLGPGLRNTAPSQADARAPWPMLAALHLEAIVFAYNEGYSKAYDGREFPNPFAESGSQAAAWVLGTRDGKAARQAAASN